MVKPQVSFADFIKVDLRVGRIVKAQAIEKSNKLIRLEVDLGKDYGKRIIIAGLLGVYNEQDLLNKKFVFVANLAPKKIAGEESEGMVLCADCEGRPLLVTIPDQVPEGTIVR